MPQDTTQLEKRLATLERKVVAQSNLIDYFSSRIIFKKTIMLKPLASNPATGQIGDLVVVGTKLKICTATTPTWTTVGTQT